jgi:hypothetical protein
MDFIKKIVKICREDGLTVTLNPFWHRTTSGIYVTMYFDQIDYIWTPFGELHLTGYTLSVGVWTAIKLFEIFGKKFENVSSSTSYCHYNQETNTEYNLTKFPQDDYSKCTLWKYMGLPNLNDLNDKLYEHFHPTEKQYELDKEIVKLMN